MDIMELSRPSGMQIIDARKVSLAKAETKKSRFSRCPGVAGEGKWETFAH
jgi:hypothetical protein